MIKSAIENRGNLQEGRDWGLLSWNGELIKLLQVRFELHPFWGDLGTIALNKLLRKIMAVREDDDDS